MLQTTQSQYHLSYRKIKQYSQPPHLIHIIHFLKPLYLAIYSAVIYGHYTKKAALISFLSLLSSQYEHLHSFLSKPEILDPHLDYIYFTVCTSTTNTINQS